MISGIVIDTFAKMREDSEERTEEMENTCFICGNTKEKINKGKEKKGFDYHIKSQHNLWHYVYFIAWVKGKQDKEYSGVESFVADLLESGDISWFPINKFHFPNIPSLTRLGRSKMRALTLSTKINLLRSTTKNSRRLKLKSDLSLFYSHALRSRS